MQSEEYKNIIQKIKESHELDDLPPPLGVQSYTDIKYQLYAKKSQDPINNPAIKCLNTLTNRGEIYDAIKQTQNLPQNEKYAMIQFLKKYFNQIFWFQEINRSLQAMSGNKILLEKLKDSIKKLIKLGKGQLSELTIDESLKDQGIYQLKQIIEKKQNQLKKQKNRSQSRKKENHENESPCKQCKKRQQKLKEQFQNKFRQQLLPQLKETIRAQLTSLVKDQLRNQFSGSIQEQIKVQSAPKIQEQLRRNLQPVLKQKMLNQLKSVRQQLEKKVKKQIESKFQPQIRSELKNTLRLQLSGEVKSELKNQLLDKIKSQVKDQFKQAMKKGQISLQKSKGNKHLLWNLLDGYLPLFWERSYPPFEPQTSYLIEIIEGYTKKQIQRTKLLYQYDGKNPIIFHQYVDGIEDYVVICKLQNNLLLAAYSHKGLRKGQKNNGPGFISTLTNKHTVYIEPNLEGSRTTSYQDYSIVFGNGQLRIQFTNKAVSSCFEKQYLYFRPKTTQKLFIGVKDEDVQFTQLQIHKIVFKETEKMSE